jgi:hypothetical protein
MRALISNCRWLLLLAAGCGSGISGGDDDDDPPDCVPTGAERPGDGADNDCDGVTDELYVCPDGSEAYTTIAEALADAPDGGGVELCAATYAERIDLAGRSIGIVGAGG